MWLLLSLAFADPIVVPAEETKQVEGPAVVLNEALYRSYVTDSRNLEACTMALDDAVNRAVAANERAVEARDIARREFRQDGDLIARQQQTIATLGVRVDAAEGKVQRLRSQRNIAVGVATGFIVAATAATVLSLN